MKYEIDFLGLKQKQKMRMRSASAITMRHCKGMWWASMTAALPSMVWP